MKKKEETSKLEARKLKCGLCGKSMTGREALVHKNKAGQREVICRGCFEKETGVDYETFAYRRESAKQVLIGTMFCLMATIYAFVEEGPLYGAVGLVLTVLIFLFAGKAK